MANPHAGEVALTLDGVRYTMRLSLGALAELETQLEEKSLVALAERFEGGSFGAGDVLAVLVAGLRGGGVWQGCARDLAEGRIEGGPLAGARAAAELLLRAFSVPGSV